MTANREFKIIAAKKTDAQQIGEAIVAALGDELPKHMAGNRKVSDVVKLFATLAARDDSQYSYLNTLKAVTVDGKAMGFIVGYDGALLHTLREAFFEEALRILDHKFTGKVADETTPDEFYLDSLAVLPEYRCRGVATALIRAMEQRAIALNKPLGLLCDKSNRKARKLYESLGFQPAGERFFAGELMDHLRTPLAAGHNLI